MAHGQSHRGGRQDWDRAPAIRTPVGTRSDGKLLTDPYPAGTTSITWTATDPAGNAASATQTVTVTDRTAPTITCPANMTVPATSAGGAGVNFTVGASDSCSGVSVVSTPPSGSLFPPGTTTVRNVATDVSGNSASCSFTVTVSMADLALSMSAKPNQVRPNSNLTYTLVVKNSGNQAATGVVLTDPLPANTTFVSASGSPNTGTLTPPPVGGVGAVSWSIGTLAAGQSATLTVVVKTSSASGSVTNTASVSSSLESNLGNNSATLTTTVR